MSWRQVKSILEQALERPQVERQEYVTRSCAGNTSLQAEVEALLDVADEQSESFLETPPTLPPSAPDQADSIWIGKRVGPFRVARRIASGGMGHVFLAHRDDGAAERAVAIKVMRTGLDSPTLRHQFDREHRLHSCFDHPYIARLIDGGTIDNQPYLVMEYVDGQPIDVYCRARRLGVRERIALFMKVCRAVEHTHAQGIVHRDIKPSNLLVTADGRPKLLDFGIASICSSDPCSDMAATVLDSAAVFTPGYAAPEQLRNRPVTPATDVYGLGALLYRLLTGQAPHEERHSTSSLAMMRAMSERDPERASRVVCRDGTGADAGLPPGDRLGRLLKGDLDRILSKALAKNPADRYGSVQELTADLRRYLDATVAARRPKGSLRHGRGRRTSRDCHDHDRRRGELHGRREAGVRWGLGGEWGRLGRQSFAPACIVERGR